MNHLMIKSIWAEELLLKLLKSAELERSCKRRLPYKLGLAISKQVSSEDNASPAAIETSFVDVCHRPLHSIVLTHTVTNDNEIAPALPSIKQQKAS